MTSVTSLVSTISKTIINPILALLFALGVLVFIFGIVEFLLGLNRGDNEAKGKGQQHMIWGLVGIFIMASAISILHIISSIVCNGNSDWNSCVPASSTANTTSAPSNSFNGNSYIAPRTGGTPSPPNASGNNNPNSSAQE